MSDQNPILVTGAAGKVGGVGRAIVAILGQRHLPVRALVRGHDERAEALSAMGAEVVLGDLTRGSDVARALEGCRRMYFGMSVSPPYLEATVIAAAAARERGDLEAFVNISQMTVSQMSLRNMTDSPQQRQHWLAEQVLGWSGLPVVQVRATVFLEHFFFSEWAASSIAKDGTIRLPFGSGRTSPPRSQDMAGMAAEYAAAVGGPVAYVDVPFDDWRDQELRSRGLPEHVFEHFVTMARLHAENRYDRMTRDVEAITGRPALTVRSYVESRPDLFGSVRH
jgi:NAD(P)H dehydrogenase (quinone)